MFHNPLASKIAHGDLAHSKPGTAKSGVLAALGVAIHGQSFGKQAEFDNIARGYPEKQSGTFNIGLLHTSLDGAKGHEPYAPCTLNDLRQKEYDYWALGHVHTRRVCCEDLPIVFPGNTQGRHIREAGSKGCYIVTANERGQCDLEFVSLDVFRWEVCAVDVTDVRQPESVLDHFGSELAKLCAKHNGLPPAVRVEVGGATEAHDSIRADPVRWTNELRAAALANPSQRIWIERIKWRTTPRRELIDASDHSGPIGTLLSYIEELRGVGAELSELGKVLDDLQRKLPDELTRGDDPLRLDDPQQLRQWLDDVEPLC